MVAKYSPEEHGVSPANLLIVDDEDLVRWSWRERLAQGGYSMREAATAADAVEQIAPAPELVRLDVRLPDGDGLMVLQRLTELSPDTLVILMTAYSTVENAVETMRLGADHYINKPFNLDEVALPPLHDWRGDVPVLAAHCIGLYNREFRKRVRGLTPSAT